MADRKKTLARGGTLEMREGQELPQGNAGVITTNLPDDVLLRFWRSVQGPEAGLTGPLIRFASLVYQEAQPSECAIPPPGWRCTRPFGHSGPCAAIPDWREPEDAPDATTELLHALNELYPVPDDAVRVERCGRTAAAVKRWMIRSMEEIETIFLGAISKAGGK
jgi:hypothetical protein